MTSYERNRSGPRWRRLPLFFGVALLLSSFLACSPRTLKLETTQSQASAQPPSESLHVAVLRGDVDAVRRHIEAGSDLNQKDAYGSTPLIVAATFGKIDAAKLLIEGGANMNLQSKEGSTPLHVAALLGRIELTKALLDKGADRYQRNNDGATAFDLVATPFDDDVWLYDELQAGLGPLGLTLDYVRLRAARPKIAQLLRPSAEELGSVEYAPHAGEDWKPSTPAAEGLKPSLVAELYFDAARLENLYGLLVVKNGHLIAERYFNGWSIDKPARLQSVTKSYTSALVGIALAQGRLSSVDQKMMDFFPELADKITDPRKQQITIRQMLQMRAGYAWEESDPGLFKILYRGFRPSYLVTFPLSSDPGTRFEYSNLTSHLLGVIVARAVHQDLECYAEEYLLSRIGAKLDHWIRDWEGNNNGHADIHLTARDAAKFGLLYLDDGRYGGNQVVPAAWVRESLESYSERVDSAGIRSGKVGRYFRDVGYGYQWWSARVGDRHFNLAWGHGGQLLVLLDDLDLLIVVVADPQFGRHGDRAWGYEQGNLNLVGKFIASLPKGSAPVRVDYAAGGSRNAALEAQ